MSSRGMIVLAGGRSQRMGRDKAWLPVGDEPALLRVVRAGLRAEVEVVVVGSPGQVLPELPDGVARVDDPADRSFEGPLSGLAVGFDRLAARGVSLACTAACDALMMSEVHVRFVLEALERSERPAVVPLTVLEDGRRRLHPLSGALRVEPARAMAHELLGQERRAARDLYDALGAETIAVAELPEPGVIRGCNTPEQWEEAVARLRARAGQAAAGDDVE